MKIGPLLFCTAWFVAAAMIVLPVSKAMLVGTEVEEPDVPSVGFSPASWIVPSTVPAPYNPQTQGDEGAFRFECAPAHLNYDDAIIYPGVQGGSSHLHQYFGHPSANYASTYASLRANNAPGTCAGGPLNNTAYWYPAMIRPQNNMVVSPDFITVYYKTTRNNQSSYTASGSGIFQRAGSKLPRGLRYVAGFNTATGLIDPIGTGFRWGCEDGTGGSHPTITALAASTNCTGTIISGKNRYQARILVRLDFGPSCWNGTSLDSPNHRSHIKNKVQDGWGNAVCPRTHPVILPTLTLIIWWSHLGASDFGQWYLSSDRMSGHTQYANGASFHTDWFGAWDPEVLNTWSMRCNGTGGMAADVRNGVGGQLCDGTGLKPTATILPEARPKYLPIPARP